MIVLKMEPDEITSMYRDAKNKFKQVQILAEMNCVSNKEMAIWLEEHGQTVDSRYFPDRRMRKSGSNIPAPTEIPPAPKKKAPAKDHDHDGGEMIEIAVMHEDGKVERHFDQSAKADAGKLQLSLVPSGIIRAVARIRMYGNEKYPGDPDNWKAVEPQRYRDAMYRHLLDYIENPDAVDEESGLPSLWHLACNAAFLIEMENKK